MKRIWAIIAICIIAVFGLTGCAADETPTNMLWASVDGGQIDKPSSGEEFYFNVSVTDALIRAGTPVHLKVAGNVESGSLRVEIRDPQGQAVWNSGEIRPGDFSVQTDYRPEAGQVGMYQIGLVWQGATKARYNLGWSALKIGPMLLLPGIGMLLVGAVFLGYVARRRLSWRYVALGAALWVLTVALKFLWAVPVNQYVYQALGVTYDNVWAPGNLVAYLYIGALTGLFEAGFTWLVLRRVRWGKTTWLNALAFGIGFGVIEALLLGMGSLANTIGVLANPLGVHTATLGNLAVYNSPLFGIEPIVERISVIFAHIFANVLLFYAVITRQARWGWLSILYKTLLDTPAGFAAFWGVLTLSKLWIIAGLVVVFGIIGWLGTVAVGRNYPAVEAAAPAPETY